MPGTLFTLGLMKLDFDKSHECTHPQVHWSSHCPCDGWDVLYVDPILPDCIQIGSPKTAIDAGSLNVLPSDLIYFCQCQRASSALHLTLHPSWSFACLLTTTSSSTNYHCEQPWQALVYLTSSSISTPRGFSWPARSVSAPHELSPLSLTSSSSLLFSSQPLAYSSLSPKLPVHPVVITKADLKGSRLPLEQRESGMVEFRVKWKVTVLTQ